MSYRIHNYLRVVLLLIHFAALPILYRAAWEVLGITAWAAGWNPCPWEDTGQSCYRAYDTAREVLVLCFSLGTFYAHLVAVAFSWKDKPKTGTNVP